MNVYELQDRTSDIIIKILYKSNLIFNLETFSILKRWTTNRATASGHLSWLHHPACILYLCVGVVISKYRTHPNLHFCTVSGKMVRRDQGLSIYWGRWRWKLGKVQKSSDVWCLHSLGCLMVMVAKDCPFLLLFRWFEGSHVDFWYWILSG